MKVGDLVLWNGGLVDNPMYGLIIGPGLEDWDWELYSTGNERTGPFTWFALDEELEIVVNEDD